LFPPDDFSRRLNGAHIVTFSFECLVDVYGAMGIFTISMIPQIM